MQNYLADELTTCQHSIKINENAKTKRPKQRLNYAKNEVQHVLASYYNKKINDKRNNLVHRLPQTKEINIRNEVLPKAKMVPTVALPIQIR